MIKIPRIGGRIGAQLKLLLEYPCRRRQFSTAWSSVERSTEVDEYRSFGCLRGESWYSWRRLSIPHFKVVDMNNSLSYVHLMMQYSEHYESSWPIQKITLPIDNFAELSETIPRATESASYLGMLQSRADRYRTSNWLHWTECKFLHFLNLPNKYILYMRI